jgi:hypothetical protein
MTSLALKSTFDGGRLISAPSTLLQTNKPIESKIILLGSLDWCAKRCATLEAHHQLYATRILIPGTTPAPHTVTTDRLSHFTRTPDT